MSNLVTDVVSNGRPEELTSTTVEALGKASAQMNEIAAEMETAKEQDTARYQELKSSLDTQAEIIEELKQKRDAELREEETKHAIEMAAEAKAYVDGIREPSLKGKIGGNAVVQKSAEKGAFLKAIMDINDYRQPERVRDEAKATLESMGSKWSDADPSKATLGSTAATGGWVIPNDPVEDLMKPGRSRSPILQLVSVVRGLNVSGVDQPFRGTSPSAASIISWGSQKTNSDLAYNGYTATMYTLAQIYDISAQFARKSQGAAEQDVMGELNDGLQRGVTNYIFQGTGSSQPFGLNAALVTSPPFSPTTTTSHTAASTTVAGNVATAVAKAAGALEARNRRAEAVLMSSTGYWTTMTYGADAAGFYINPAAGAPGSDLVAQMSVWGIPIYREPEYLAGSDDLIVGEFSAAKVYFGDGPRFDSSDVANTRWDYNLIGFRGELEMAFDARPAVYSGAFQIVLDVVA